jgi:hypothetical protein
MAVVASALILPPALAEEQDVQNDSFAGGEVVIVGDFYAGEMAAVTLTSPCAGSIVAVQVYWLANDPGALETLEENIWIFDVATPSGMLHHPGPVLLQLEGPVMTPGYMNEFRYLDEAGTIPINVPVTSGQQFLVALEFGEATDILNGTASVVRDMDGCQDGKNWLYGSVFGPIQWHNFCAFPLSLDGDLIIRAVVDCSEATGACCNFDATCTNGVEQGDCQGGGQTFFVGQSCLEVTCPPPTGGCCLGGECYQDIEQELCEAAGGIYAGDGTDCGDGVCDQGACCTILGECSEVIQAECLAQNGTFLPGGVCDPNPCEQPTGACCVSGTFCFPGQEEAACVNGGNIWAGPFTDCFDDLCPICDDGDANQDGYWDLRDVQQFQICFDSAAGGADPCKCVDTDNDNDVDLDDLALFEAQLQNGGPE